MSAVDLSQSHAKNADTTSIKNFCFAGAAKLIYGEACTYPKQTNQSPIGVFDSGVGGLSILKHLQALLPHEHYIYLADTAHVPYGERSDADIALLTHKAVDWLYNQGCKLVVVACNSASAYSLDSLRPLYGERLPIVGLVPAIKPAAQSSHTKHIAVLATKATLSGRLLAHVINDFATPLGVTVHRHCLASLVPWVEAGMSPKHQGYDDLHKLLIELKKSQVDKLVLGCTHYPFFKPHIHQTMPEFEVIDSGKAIARRVRYLLYRSAQLTHQAAQRTATFKPFTDNVAIYSTGDTAKDKKKIKRLKYMKNGAVN